MISVVIPCYNEENNIHNVVKRFVPIQEKFKSIGFELILVNNGSKDGTSAMIDDEIKKYDFIKKVSVEKNLGYGYGILEGLKKCNGEWLGWIHADLQLPPEAFLDFADIIEKEPDKSKQSYFKGRRKKRPILDTFFTIMMGIFESIYLGQKLWDINAQPSLIHRDFYKKLVDPPYDFSFDLYVYYLAKKNNLNIVRVPVIQQEREEGVSSWNNGMKDRMKFIKNTLKFSRNLKKGIKEKRYE